MIPWEDVAHEIWNHALQLNFPKDSATGVQDSIDGVVMQMIE